MDDELAQRRLDALQAFMTSHGITDLFEAMAAWRDTPEFTALKDAPSHARGRMTMGTEYRYTAAAWAEAFTIFEKYQPGEMLQIAVDHDVIYAGEPSLVSDEDKVRLDELGWIDTGEQGFGFRHFV